MKKGQIKKSLNKAYQVLHKNLREYLWWEIVIFVFGIASFLTLIYIIFIPIGRGPSTLFTTSPIPPVENPEFLHAFSDSLSLPLKTGEAVTILNNGDDFLPSLLGDIDEAETSINIMLYIWKEGEMSDQVLGHLNKKLQEGVEIRILLDGFGSLGAADRKEFKKFKDMGGKVEMFRSLSVIPWNFVRNQNRNHRRSITIDGEIGYTGGMAIQDEWLGDARNKDEWRDMMFRTTGEMVHDIQSTFVELWVSNTGEILTGEKFYPPVSVPIASGVKYVSLLSIPSTDSLAMSKFLLLSIQGAQNKIYITNPYFLPDKTMKDLLIDKAQSGVDVQILLPNKYNDNRGVRNASQRSYEGLLEGGVKIYEYQPTFLHSKAMVIDGTWSLIGSANLDNRSRQLNEENIIGISDNILGQELENIFLQDLNNSIEITLEEWSKRSIWQKAKEVFAIKLIQQY